MNTFRKPAFVQRKVPAVDAAYGTRIPPHSLEAEESVLGGILLDNEAINVALERLTAEDFYRPDHSAIFAAMGALVDRNEPIDVITLSQQLRSAGTLEQCGGPENLARLSSAVPSSANVGYYARVVKEMSLRRKVIHEASMIISQAFDIEGEVEEFLDATEQKILGVSENRVRPSFHRVSDVIHDSIKLVEKLYNQKDMVTGVPTGFDKLNEFTAGFQPSDLIIIAARPSMGKTALALNMAQYIAIHSSTETPRAVAFFTLEMSKEQLVLRMLCGEARVDNSKVRVGNLGDRDFPRLVEAASRISNAPIFLDDTPAVTVTEVRAKARRLHREHPLSLIIVDYLQLMRSPTYSHSREQEISDISRSLKALAKELNVPVIALSQLNRSVESRNDKRPQMSDLRESGAIEQDADIIMFIYRDEVYNKENSPDKGIAELIISKQRTGPTGTVRLAFSPEFTRFDSLFEGEVAQDDGGGTPPDFGPLESDPF
ncbi:MAG: replicative DNA helicase [Oligoflexia bacterium]|nr:replicative DNA helicase [Oligoflexia bacterium]